MNIKAPFQSKRANQFWRVGIVLTTPIWFLICATLLVLGLLLCWIVLPLFGFVEGGIRFIITGKFESRILEEIEW